MATTAPAPPVTSPVTPEEQRRFYEENGFLLVKGVLPPDECAARRQELHDLAARLRAKRDINATWRGSHLSEEERKGLEIWHCHDVQFYLASFSRLLVDSRVLDPIANLIGENIQLHHTKMFIKPPEKGSPFPMHQDYYYFPHERKSMIAAILHFDDAPIEKGCIRVVPGSHKLGPIEHVQEGGWHLPFEQYPLESSVACPAQSGDVLFFSYLTIHGSGVNVSNEARTTLLIQMRDPLDPPTVKTHESRGQGMMLRGFDANAVP
jgi:phytanoyl-CoA hydroxylase